MTRSPPLRLFAAGSLRAVFADLLPRAEATIGAEIAATYGPAGLLCREIERGARCDLFASAALALAQGLADQARADAPIVFAGNRLGAVARRGLGLTTASVLDIALDPTVRIGTSTPGADPGGDYAHAVFARADALRPGATATLTAKARALVGGGLASEVPPGMTAAHWMLETEAADLAFAYRTSLRPLAGDPRFDVVDLPETLDVRAIYALAPIEGRMAATERLIGEIIGPSGQATLRAHGFLSAADLAAGA